MPSADAPISFSFAGLSDSYCFTGFNRFALDIVAQMSGFLPGEYSTIIKSEDEPSAEDRSKMWYKLLPGGAPGGLIFNYYSGAWVAPNPIEPESEERKWWTGSEADLWAYDGGDGTDPVGNPPTATTGAMWVRDTDYDFRFPLAMGTSPKPTTVSPGDTGGQEENTIDTANVPEHEHPLVTATNAINGSINLTGADYVAKWGGSNEGAYTLAPEPGSATPSLGKTGPFGAATGDITPISNMPPYRVGMWAKRSSRIYFVA